MALPTITKTWEYGTADANINQAIAASGTALTTNRTLLLALKNALINAGLTKPWQIRGSCNGGGTVSGTNYDAVLASGAAGPNTDRWLTTANLVWNTAGSNHSWIVLRQTGIGSTFEILIACEGSSANGITLYISGAAGGYQNGNGTTRPTAISGDEVVILNTANFGGMNTDAAIKLHVMVSSDGQCNRIVIFSGSLPSCFALVDKPRNPVTGWSNPWIGAWSAAASGSSTIAAAAAFYGASGNITVGRGSANMTMWLTGESAKGYTTPLNAAGIQRANDLSGEYYLPGIGLYSETASNSGRHGEVFDLWWANTVLTEGSGFAATAPTLRVAGDFAFPFKASTALAIV